MDNNWDRNRTRLKPVEQKYLYCIDIKQSSLLLSNLTYILQLQIYQVKKLNKDLKFLATITYFKLINRSNIIV